MWQINLAVVMHIYCTTWHHITKQLILISNPAQSRCHVPWWVFAGTGCTLCSISLLVNSTGGLVWRGLVGTVCVGESGSSLGETIPLVRRLWKVYKTWLNGKSWRKWQLEVTYGQTIKQLTVFKSQKLNIFPTFFSCLLKISNYVFPCCISSV